MGFKSSNCMAIVSITNEESSYLLIHGMIKIYLLNWLELRSGRREIISLIV